jgi:hypothetical protein
MKFVLRACLLVLAVAVAPAAHSALILDTGVPGGSGSQSLTTRAAQFTLSSTTTIDSIAHWLSVSTAGTATFAVYGDAAGLPGTQLFAQAASLAMTEGGTAPDWRGISGLAWTLPAGTYWASYEVRPGQSIRFRRPIGGVNTLPPNPAAREATKFSLDISAITDPWQEAGGSTGWRVSGTVAAAVPEPGTLGLLALGLLAAGAARRQLRKP